MKSAQAGGDLLAGVPVPAIIWSAPCVTDADDRLAMQGDTLVRITKVMDAGGYARPRSRRG